jgi:hypothetical protein
LKTFTQEKRKPIRDLARDQEQVSEEGEIMKANILRRAAGFFSILILLAAFVADFRAHAAPSSTTVFNVPFDFVVAGKTLPAGSYLVVRSTLYSKDILSLRRLDDNEGVYVLTLTVESNEAQKDSKLVFNHYQDQYFLSEFWTSGETTGRKVLKSEKEKSLARAVEKGGTKTERVAVFSRQQ